MSTAICRCSGVISFDPGTAMFKCAGCHAAAKKLSDLTGRSGYAGGQLVKFIQQSRRASPSANVVLLSTMAHEALRQYCETTNPGKDIRLILGVTPMYDDSLNDDALVFQNDPHAPGYIEKAAIDRFPDEELVDVPDQEAVLQRRGNPPRPSPEIVEHALQPQKVEMPSLCMPPRASPRVIEQPRLPAEGQRVFKVTLVVNAESQEVVEQQMQALKMLMKVSDIDVAPLLVEAR